MYGRRVRRNDDAQEILDPVYLAEEGERTRRAGIVRRNKQMFLDFIRSELAKPSTSAFKVGEILLSESPHDPGYPMEVIYRGKVGDKATVAYDGGRQMTVPLAWLSRPAKPKQKSEYIDLDPKETLDPSVPTLVKRKPYEALQRRKEESIRKHAEKDLQKRLARKRGVLPDWTPSVDSDGSTVVWTAPSGLARVKDSGGGYDERFSAEGLYPDGWSLVGKGPRIGEMFKAAKAENRAALREKRLAEISQPKVTPQVTP